MFGQANVLAAGQAAFPPSVEDFYLPSILPWGAHDSYWFTKITAMVWIAVGVLIIFFLATYRNPQLVPTKKQWLAESIYGFVRNNIAVDMIGHAGVRFAPYFTTLFCFVLLTNVFAIVPFFQISPNSHIAFPAILAVISYVLFNYVGIKQHGFVKYFKNSLVPPAPVVHPAAADPDRALLDLHRPAVLAGRSSLRQHVRRPHAPAGLHARRLRDAQRQRLARAGLGALLGDDHRAHLPRVPGRSACRPTSSPS